MVACWPNGRRSEIAPVPPDLVPRAVSCYLHDYLSPTMAHVEGVGENIYIYYTPQEKRLAVGKYLAAEWKKEWTHIRVYAKEDGSFTQYDVARSLKRIPTNEVLVGRRLVCLDGIKIDVLTPEGSFDTCVFTCVSTIEENADRIAVYDRHKKVILCWEWGAEKYGEIEVPQDGDVRKLFIRNGEIFAFARFWEEGLFRVSFPEFTIDAPFPALRRGQRGDRRLSC